MKLEKILENLNSFEKNPFLKIIDGIVNEKPNNAREVDQILSENNKDLKSIDNLNIARVFSLIEAEFTSYIRREFNHTTSQLDILVDIISREGNSIMKQDWFARLYEKELKELEKHLKVFKAGLYDEKSDFDTGRRRDYLIYLACLRTAYHNDELNNQDNKVTTDEQSILNTLANQLELSQEEIKMINYLIVPVQKLEIETIINDLKSTGAIFYSKKTNTIYVADEISRILRKIRGKEVSDKFFRRVLRNLKEPQINLICKKHGIDRKLDIEQKIQRIIDEGISFSGVLKEDIYRDGTSLTEKKKFINELIEKNLKITNPIKGIVLEEKITNLIAYFEQTEKDEKVGISLDGYDKLLKEMNSAIPSFKNLVKSTYQFQEEDVLKSSFLLDYNIKPKDVLEIVPEDLLEIFCKDKEIKTRGDVIFNILDSYRDAENLYLENYEHIGFRNIAALKNNNIDVREVDLGIKFEVLTKKIFESLGFTVDEPLRNALNTAKDKVDILLTIGNNEVIIVECKTVKENGYNKFSSVSRQLKSYAKRIESQDYKVVKSILVAPDFSDDFIKDCGLEYDLNLSLITASTLIKVFDGFKQSKLKKFPHNLFMRDVLIQEERVLKAIGK
ncbi:hypothetical protein [Negadavirga shengliensis]|uniref:Restriction endonuclease type IV Mrr domain-containing protein n=1 Tax=Negadavirga shengliensis TaxID=1389218 RepID=A0ABV9SWJ4_9BACT